MRRLFAYLITTVPVLAAPGLNSPASAAEFTPLAVTELLSKTYVADARCRFLESAEHEELARYVAHTQLAATEIEGASSTKRAIEHGRVSGESAECSPAIRQQTISTLVAARRAMAAVGNDDGGESDSADDISLPLDAMSTTEGLGVYQRRMGAYLLDLRCRYLSKRHAKNFWALIVEEHKAALGKFGLDAVGLAKTRAHELSTHRECNSQSEELVRNEYREMEGR